jgi:hypothetical protein
MSMHFLLEESVSVCTARFAQNREFFFVLAIDPQGYMVYRIRRKAKFSNLLAPL